MSWPRVQNSAKNKLFQSYRKTAKYKGYDFDLTEEEFFNLVTKSCYYCGIEPSNKMKTRTNEFIYNGIDRVDNLLGYSIDNCVPCCSTCNYAKRNLTKDQFINWIKRIYITQYHKITDITPGQLVDLLVTVNMKCWWQQEHLMDTNLSEDERLNAAIKAQELNAKRTKLIRTIDSVLDYTEDTNIEKTYDKEKENYTYFDKERKHG